MKNYIILLLPIMVFTTSTYSMFENLSQNFFPKKKKQGFDLTAMSLEECSQETVQRYKEVLRQATTKNLHPIFALLKGCIDKAKNQTERAEAIETMKTALKNGARLNTANTDCITPLTMVTAFAAAEGDTAILETLLEHGADVDYKGCPKGISPFEMMRALASKKNPKIPYALPIFDLLKAYTLQIKSIHAAAQICDSIFIKSLVNKNNAQELDENGFPPLFYAIKACSDVDNEESKKVIDTLVKYGANPNHLLRKRPTEFSLMHLAAIAGAETLNMQVLQHLINNGGNPDYKVNKADLTPREMSEELCNAGMEEHCAVANLFKKGYPNTR